MTTLDSAERERLERLARRVEDDYDFAEKAGHSEETLRLLEAKHARLDAKLGNPLV